jgi:dihydroneopterin aldolase
MVEPPLSRPRRVSSQVFVRGLAIEAEIGVHSHEHGRRQPLTVDVEVDLDHTGSARLADTVDYEAIAAHARAIAEEGHITLVETFAWRLAEACLAMAHVRRVRVRIEKPRALSPHAAAAGVEIVLERD